MGFFDSIKNGDRYKEEAERLRSELTRCKGLLTPEMQEASALQERVAALNESAAELERRIAELSDHNESLEKEVAQKKAFLTGFDELEEMESFSLYTPRFDFQTAEEYATRISQLRQREKDMLKAINEATKKSQWAVNGSKAKGRKMVRETTKLLMNAFNSECDEIVRKTKFSNIEKSVENISKIAARISKLGSTMGISIPAAYVELKQNEAYIQYDYSCFKQAEKERLRELREQEREEAKLRKEIEEKRRQLAKERKQNENALSDIMKRLDSAGDDERAALLERKQEIENALGEISKAEQDVDYREANQRAGFVYVISNIGSFGEGVYKIGMTRRLDPMERIYELSDASVPFNFDVHAMIFTEDAPGLEAALHREFDDRKVNKVNTRREFFRVTLDEIKRVVRENYDKTVEFVDIPDAEQFRISQKMQ